MATMFRIALALGVCQASRIRVHEGFEADSHVKFGASCEDLQHQFHDRVTTIQASLEGVDEQTDLSAGAKARVAMRMQGIVRTLRRARECSWVVENDSEDIDQMRGVVQQLLAGNQCAEAARLEMQRGSSDENNDSLRNAVGILMSDDCEVPVVPEGNTDSSAEEQLQEVEDGLQDQIDELNSYGEGSAFMEVDKSQTIGSFFRGVGVVLLLLFFLLACITTAIAITLVLALAFVLVCQSILVWHPSSRSWLPSFIGRGYGGGIIEAEAFGVVGGALLGVVSCAYQMFNTLLPRMLN